MENGQGKKDNIRLRNENRSKKKKKAGVNKEGQLLMSRMFFSDTKNWTKWSSPKIQWRKKIAKKKNTNNKTKLLKGKQNEKKKSFWRKK